MISENGETTADGSICGYDSLHQLLSANLKPELYQVNCCFFFLYLIDLVKFVPVTKFRVLD